LLPQLPEKIAAEAHKNIAATSDQKKQLLLILTKILL
jgi:hypothetical protein